MKAVMASVPQHILESRRRSGADQWDEMWEGVLHMAPSPNRDHQDIEGALESWLRQHWAVPNGCRVYHQINIAEAGTWPDNYRIPDLVLLTPDRFHIDRNEYFDGGPDAVVEIRSPDDETYDKLEFYARVGVREVWVIDRDTKRTEILELAGQELLPRAADVNGWVRSTVANVELRGSADDKLEIRVVNQPNRMGRLP